MAFPVANSTTTFWRHHVHDLDTHRSTPELPQQADVVIIGAGYSGAAIAHHLVEQTPASSNGPSVVILEAREACSGATGRNGGHLKPDPYSRAAQALRAHGQKAAEEVASFEARQVKEIKDFVLRESIDCDFVVTRACDVCFYDDVDRELKQALHDLTAAGVSTVDEVFYSGSDTVEGVSGIKDAKSCFTHTAAHLYPYKLVLHLLSKAIRHGVNLQTNTPVTSVSPSSHDPDTWSVATSRGTIRASKVIFSTNAYTSSLLPQFQNKIIPVRGICARIVPQSIDPPYLSNSYILRFSPTEYDYLIPRSDGSIVVGGARRDYFADLEQWYGNTDDSTLIEPAKNYFDGYMQRHFRGWSNVQTETESLWSGIMGFSSDSFPHVGPVPGTQGQYICAGFSGHGMPQIWLCAKATAEMVLQQKEPVEVDLPLLFRASQERLDTERNDLLEGWEAVYGKAANGVRL